MDDVLECILPTVSPFKTHATCYFPNCIQRVFCNWSREFLTYETKVKSVLTACLIGDFVKGKLTFRAWKVITQTLSRSVCTQF